MKKDVLPAIFTWLKRELDIPAIVEKPNVPRPKPPYLSVNIVTPITKVGSRDSVENISNSSFNIGGQRRFTLGVKSYVDPKDQSFFDAQDLLIKLQDSLEDPTKRLPLTEAGLAVFFANDILDVTELLETGFEPRAQLDVEMGIASNRTTDLGAIETVKITPTVNEQEEPEFQVPSQS